MRGNDRGMIAYMEAIFELEQLITKNDIECSLCRNEAARQGGKLTESQTEAFYTAKAKAIYNFIKALNQ